jgi:hypothetical protein
VYLVFWQNPTQSPHAWRRTNDAMQRNLPNLDQLHGSVVNIDDVVIENVIVGIDEQGVFSRRSNEHNGGGQLLHMHNVRTIEGELARVDANLRNCQTLVDILK